MGPRLPKALHVYADSFLYSTSSKGIIKQAPRTLARLSAPQFWSAWRPQLPGSRAAPPLCFPSHRSFSWRRGFRRRERERGRERTQPALQAEQNSIQRRSRKFQGVKKDERRSFTTRFRNKRDRLCASVGYAFQN